MSTQLFPEPFSAARFIKEIGRGKDGARDLSRADAALLYQAMLERRVSDLELGAILLSMRIKGESVDEIAGFMDAADASFTQLQAPPGDAMPVLIPTYNGARKMANLTPLLAMLLSREGVPVLVHGVLTDPGRVTTAEIFAALGWPLSATAADAERILAGGTPAFIAIDDLAPQIAGLLALRRILGVRSSTHTLVKILQPFAGPALRLSSYTHPEYLIMLGAYFSTAAPVGRGDAFLMRGTEGETVANARRAQQIDWFHEGQRTTLVEKQGVVDTAPDMPPERDAETTARWIERVLEGAHPVPVAIATQVARCAAIARGKSPDLGEPVSVS
ncbi:MAG: DNA-binding protein YbiB [Herminiimonas sp.]|nr:DNA-binding protein YbiB [Herminiimonas sp.]